MSARWRIATGVSACIYLVSKLLVVKYRLVAAEPAHRLFLECGVDTGLGNGLIDFGFCAARRDPADGFAVHFDGQAALVWEKVGECETVHIAFFDVLGAVLGRSAIGGRMPRL